MKLFYLDSPVAIDPTRIHLAMESMIVENSPVGSEWELSADPENGETTSAKVMRTGERSFHIELS